MIKVVLLTDLDNTIIHGKKKYRTGDICVEKDNSGKEITYMGSGTFKRFLFVQEQYKDILEIIPVTSRSEAEYLRILDTGLLNFHYAFIDNGAGLMEGNVRYTKGVWGESGEAFSLNPYLGALEQCVDRVRLVDDCFYYGKLKDGVTVDDSVVLGKTAEGSCVYLQRSGNKLYLLTDKASKENAIKAVYAYNKVYGCGDICLICAGDSVMDTVMAKWADTAVFSDDVRLSGTGSCTAGIQFVRNSGDNLINAVLDNVTRLCEEAKKKSAGVWDFTK